MQHLPNLPDEEVCEWRGRHGHGLRRSRRPGERSLVHEPIHLEYHGAPGALAFMARAMVVPAWFRPTDGLISLAASWHGHRVAGYSLDSFLELTNLTDNPRWQLLYPLVVGFRLQMALLTHPAFPFPIWGALQVRNHVVLHRPFARDDVVDMHTEIYAKRGLDKGAEMDLHSTARITGELSWECVNTFYYRGVRGSRDKISALAVAPTVVAPVAARWVAPVAGRWRFGRLTGDYNGIHQWSWYARLFGFRGAFQHPQRALGQCLTHLPRPITRGPFCLDTWLKGPVYYGAELALRVAQTQDVTTFALHVNGDERPAIIGRVTTDAAHNS